MKPGVGYWCNIGGNDTLVGNYDLWPEPGFVPPSVVLIGQSWNLIGHWHTYYQPASTSSGGALANLGDTDIGSLWRYNTGGGYTNIMVGNQNMEPGEGYWVFIKSSSNPQYAPS